MIFKGCKGRNGSLHDSFRVPNEGVGVKIRGRVEPHVELLLSIAFSLANHVGVDGVRVAAQVAQELEINLVPCRTFGSQL